MRLLGLPIVAPHDVLIRAAADLQAVARLARSAPAQFDRLLELGEEIVQIGRGVREITERLDRRAGEIMAVGERLDARAGQLLELGTQIRDLGDRLEARGAALEVRGEEIVTRGAEIVEGATRVANTGGELIAVLPTLERAIEMTTPLEGAIDRFGRLVDRLPGGPTRRRAEGAARRAEGAARQAEQAAASQESEDF